MFYEIGFSFGAVLSLLIGVIVFQSDSTRQVNRSWALLSSCVSIWFFGRLMILTSANSYTAFQWQRVAFTGSIFLTVVYLDFVYAYLDKKKDWVIFLGYTSTTALNISNISSNLFINEMRRFPIVNFYEQAGPLYVIHLLNYIIFPTYGFLLLQKQKAYSEGWKRNQISYLLLASNIGFICGLTTFPLNFGINFPPIGAPFISIYIFIITYAILIHRLLDFNLIMRWGVAYGTTLSVIALIYLSGVFSLEILVSKIFKTDSTGLIIITMACIAVYIFDPIRRKVSQFIDKIIFKSPDYKILLIGIEEELKKAGSLEIISSGLVKHFKKIWNVDHAGIGIWDSSISSYHLWPSTEFNNQIIARLSEPILKSDFLVKTLETERRLFKYGIVSEDELTNIGKNAFPGERITFWKIRRTMRWIGAAICVPLMFKEQLIGFIALGFKKNRSMFNNEDKKFLSHISEVLCGSLLKQHVLRVEE